MNGRGPRRPDGFIQKSNARYDRHDALYRKAKKEGFAARSVYKLEEIDRETKLLRARDRVLDLGCAPGSWLQYVDQKLTHGAAVGIDLLPTRVALTERVRVLQGDAFDTSLEELTGTPPGEPLRLFNVVLSDMAPNTTGIKTVDQARSLALCERALEVAERALVPGGRMCVKIFEGGDMKQFLDACKQVFGTVKVKRPKGTRAGSVETYVIGLDRLPVRR
ncbi:MAG: RlmE family RNA methyltransferase [Deltaproteobacteria bacterium]|nr:RlmE family RNA methyltransferase [Deltaproteobacteria bacterium]